MAFSPNAQTVYADGPAGSPLQPAKSEIRKLLKQYENVIDAFTASGGKIYSSKAAMDADLSLGSNNMAWVMGDPVAANNGVYRKTGAAGTGSWIRLGDLPYSFIIASDAGAGTANAIQATTSIPVSGSALIWLSVFEANTAAPVTVSFNGGSVLTIKTNAGNDVTVGGLTAGMIVMGIISGSTFRLISDQASASLLAGAEAAAATATAAAASLSSRVDYSVDILDYTTSAAQRTALINGSIGLKSFWDDAAADAVSRGIKMITLPAGNFELDSGAVLDNPGVHVRGESRGTRLYKNGPGRMFQTTRTAPNVTTDGAALTANAAAGATTITLSTSDAAGFAPGSLAVIRSALLTSGQVSRDAEFVRIRSVNTGTGVITLYGPLYFPYATANTAKLFPITLTEGVGYENLIADWADGTPTSPQRPPYNIDEAFVATFCNQPLFRNVETRKTISTSIMLHACLNAYVENYAQFDGFCDGFDMVDAYSYGVAEVGLNKGLIVNGGHSERSRHFYTTGGSDISNIQIFLGGHPMFSKISHVSAYDMKAAGGDTHDAGIEVEFIDCHVVGARGAGFQLRSYGARLTGCSVRGILPRDGTTDQGHGVYLVGTLADGLYARDCRINNFKAYDCYGAGVYDQSRGARGRNIEITKTNLPGIVASGTGSGDFDYDDITMEDVAKSPGGLGTYAVTIGTALQKNPVIRNLKVKDPNNNVTALVRRNDFAVNLVEMSDVRGVSGSNLPIREASSVTNTDGMIIRGGFGPQSVGPIPQVTIVSDSIDVSKLFAGGASLLPESSTTDQLVTATNGERDDKLVLWGSASNTITIVHGSGANNFFLQGAANVNLGANQCMTFTLRGGVWIEDSERNF